MSQYLMLIALLVGSSANAGNFDAVADQTADCLLAKDYYFAKLQRAGETIEVDCGQSNHHYHPLVQSQNQAQSPQKDKIRMGGFNLFKMGRSDAEFKDYDLVARIINEYDVIAGLEIFPLTVAETEHNERIVKTISDFPKVLNPDQLKLNIERLQSDLVSPSYLNVLRSLWKIDRSWGMVIGPRALYDETTQASTPHLELYAFYYRSSAVEPIATERCGNEIACEFPFLKSQEDIQLAFPRAPLIASFKAGNFDFTMLANHTRFRHPKGTDPKNPSVPMFQRMWEKLLNENTFDAELKEPRVLVREYMKDENDEPVTQAVVADLSRVTSRNPEGLVSEGMLSLKDGTGFMFKYTSKKINKKSVKLYHLMLARGQQVPLKGGFYLERVKSADGKMLTQVFDASGRAQLDEADYELEDGQYRVGFAASAMETMARFAEVGMITQLMEDMRTHDKEKDLIVVGDFNLTLSTQTDPTIPDMTRDAWNTILDKMPGSQVVVNEKTSVSKLNAYANEYDHFIFDPKNVKECDLNSAHRFNFIDPKELLDNFGQSSQAIGLAIEERAKNWLTDTQSMTKKMVSQYEQLGEILIDDATGEMTYRKRYPATKAEEDDYWTNSSIETLIEDLDSKLVSSQSNVRTKFEVYMALVSDHLPVAMDCKTSEKDDD